MLHEYDVLDNSLLSRQKEREGLVEGGTRHPGFRTAYQGHRIHQGRTSGRDDQGHLIGNGSDELVGTISTCGCSEEKETGEK